MMKFFSISSGGKVAPNFNYVGEGSRAKVEFSLRQSQFTVLAVSGVPVLEFGK
jgi:hypothetical protein